MLQGKKVRDLARVLVDRETDPNASTLYSEPATVRVYERLRRQLSAPVGVDGFQALASRALALAKAESSRFDAVQVMANGGLRGFDAVDSPTDAGEDGEAGVLLIAKLLGLFLSFLGEATTLRLLEDLRLQGEASRKPVAALESESCAAEEQVLVDAAFDDLLVEIDRLRSVSEHIEALAETHPSMESGLASVAGNIRNIATVLDVLTLIRSRAGGPQEDLPNLQTNLYMN